MAVITEKTLRIDPTSRLLPAYVTVASLNDRPKLIYWYYCPRVSFITIY